MMIIAKTLSYQRGNTHIKGHSRVRRCFEYIRHIIGSNKNRTGSYVSPKTPSIEGTLIAQGRGYFKPFVFKARHNR
jgi:hypothetical protein